MADLSQFTGVEPGDRPPAVTPAIRHPDIRQEITDPAKKADLFRDTFFPTPPEADLRDIQDAGYNDQVETPLVTEKEVRDAIHAASPLKASGPDGIVNRALQAGVALTRCRQYTQQSCKA